MRLYKKISSLISGSIICFAVSFFSLSAIPLIALLPRESRRIPQYIVASLFWLFLIAALALVRITSNRLFAVRRKLAERGLRVRQKRDGLFTFSAQPGHLILYAVGAAGLLLLAADLIFGFLPGGVVFPLLSATLFSIALHAILDGRNYKTLELLGKRMEERRNETDA